MKKKILVVEDDPTNLELVRQLLEDDYEILVARTGHEAIAVALEDGPDLILMDLSMPQLDGWEATTRLRRYETTRHTPILALSAHAAREEKQLAAAAGCDDYITKPIDEDVFLRQIGKWLAHEGRPDEP